MKVSKKAETAFKIIELLKDLNQEEVMKGPVIFKELDRSSADIEAIIAKLKKIGVVETRRGVKGGYRLDSQYGVVSAGDVINVFNEKEYVKTDTILDELHEEFVCNASAIPLCSL